MKMAEIRKLTNSEVKEKLLEFEQELFNLRFRHKINQLENPMRIRLVKKDIARIKTLIRENELAQN